MFTIFALLERELNFAGTQRVKIITTLWQEWRENRQQHPGSGLTHHINDQDGDYGIAMQRSQNANTSCRNHNRRIVYRLDRLLLGNKWSQSSPMTERKTVMSKGKTMRQTEFELPLSETEVKCDALVQTSVLGQCEGRHTVKYWSSSAYNVRPPVYTVTLTISTLQFVWEIQSREWFKTLWRPLLPYGCRDNTSCARLC